ncbi:hypothetical protein [Tsukamurella paurometabola]|uniref:Uncharacterized protein n=1 Tax=Tsukamurella paurometabola TaxID=2061 RepID=A0A3P8MCD0_TSUPA|nr:hypothetical protein [Tsukamurella paurometabola]UEA83305.1 hypothetical protein LK411_00130 [Tsukamurella paurometabola]VDR40410.1 Uncharacterised protein [Tsukamurella paurometabola]
MPRKNPVLNRAARDLLPHLCGRIVTVTAGALGPLQKVAESTHPTLQEAYQALASLRAARGEIERAELELVGCLAMGGMAQIPLARVVGVRRETLSQKLAAVPWATARHDSLVRDADAPGGWIVRPGGDRP